MFCASSAFVLLFTFWSQPQYVNALDLYVSATGSPTSNCTSILNPCNSFQKAINMSLSNSVSNSNSQDTVWIGVGEFVLDPPPSAYPANITLYGSGPYNTTLSFPTGFQELTKRATIRNLKIKCLDGLLPAPILIATLAPLVLVDVVLEKSTTPYVRSVAPSPTPLGVNSSNSTSNSTSVNGTSNATNVTTTSPPTPTASPTTFPPTLAPGTTPANYVGMTLAAGSRVRSFRMLQNFIITLDSGSSISDSDVYSASVTAAEVTRVVFRGTFQAQGSTTVIRDSTIMQGVTPATKDVIFYNVSGIENNVTASLSPLILVRGVTCESNQRYDTTTYTDPCGQHMIVIGGFCRCRSTFTCLSGVCRPDSWANQVFPTGGLQVWGHGDYNDVRVAAGDVLKFVWGSATSRVALYNDLNEMRKCSDAFTVISASKNAGESFLWTVPAAGNYYVASPEFCHIGSQFVVWADNTALPSTCYVNPVTNVTSSCTLPFSVGSFVFSQCVRPVVFASVFNLTYNTPAPTLAPTPSPPTPAPTNASNSTNVTATPTPTPARQVAVAVPDPLGCKEGFCTTCTSGTTYLVQMRSDTSFSLSATYADVTISYGTVLNFLTHLIAPPIKVAGRPDITVRPHRVRRVVFTLSNGTSCSQASYFGETVPGSYNPTKSFLMPPGTYNVSVFSMSSNMTDKSFLCGNLVPRFTVIVTGQPSDSVCQQSFNLFSFNRANIIPSGIRAYSFPELPNIGPADCVSICASQHNCRFVLFTPTTQSCFRFSHRVRYPNEFVIPVNVSDVVGTSSLEYVAHVPLSCPGLQRRKPVNFYYVTMNGNNESTIIDGVDDGNCGLTVEKPCRTMDFVINGVAITPVRLNVTSNFQNETLLIYQPDVLITQHHRSSIQLAKRYWIGKPGNIAPLSQQYTVAIYASRVTIIGMRFYEGDRSKQQDVVVYVAPNASHTTLSEIVVNRSRTVEEAGLPSMGLWNQGYNTSVFTSYFVGTLNTAMQVDGNTTTVDTTYFGGTTSYGIQFNVSSTTAIVRRSTFTAGVSVGVTIRGRYTVLLENTFSISQRLAVGVGNAAKVVTIYDNTFSTFQLRYQFAPSKLVDILPGAEDVNISPDQRCWYQGGPDLLKKIVTGQACMPGTTLDAVGCTCNDGTICSVDDEVLSACNFPSDTISLQPNVSVWRAGMYYDDSYNDFIENDVLVFVIPPGNELRLYTDPSIAILCSDYLLSGQPAYTLLAKATTQTVVYEHILKFGTNYFIEPTDTCETVWYVNAEARLANATIRSTRYIVNATKCLDNLASECSNVWGPYQYYDIENVTAGTKLAFPPSSYPILEVDDVSYRTCTINSRVNQISGLTERNKTIVSPPIAAGQTRYFFSTTDLCVKGLAKFKAWSPAPPPPPPTPEPPLPIETDAYLPGVTTINNILYSVFHAGPVSQDLRSAFLADLYDSLFTSVAGFNAKLLRRINASSLSITAVHPGSVVVLWALQVPASTAAAFTIVTESMPFTNVSRTAAVYTTRIDPTADVSVDPARSNLTSCFAQWIRQTQLCGVVPSVSSNVTCMCYVTSWKLFSRMCRNDPAGIKAEILYFIPSMKIVCPEDVVTTVVYRNGSLTSTSGATSSRNGFSLWYSTVLVVVVLGVFSSVGYGF